MTDWDREARIRALQLSLLLAPTPDSRRRTMRQLQAEIASRSAEQVERMERQLGLR